MRKLFLFFLTMWLTLWGAQHRIIQTTLSSVHGDRAVASIGPVPIGSSGIVVHAYDQNHHAIIAHAVVTKSEQGHTELILRPYRALNQTHLPNTKTTATQGDHLYLGYLYNRVLPIVPNHLSFVRAKEHFSAFHLLHPDLLAAELAKKKQPIPRRTDIQAACQTWHAGLVMIMFSDRTDFIDCQTWSRIGSENIASINPKQFKTPFYHRLKKIPAPLLSWGQPTMNHFDTFYTKLEKKR